MSSDQKLLFFTRPINSFPLIYQPQSKLYDAKHCTAKDFRTKDMDGGREVAYLHLPRLLRIASFIINRLNHFISIMLT